MIKKEIIILYEIIKLSDNCSNVTLASSSSHVTIADVPYIKQSFFWEDNKYRVCLLKL